MNTIRLIITNGCIGCDIAKNLIKKAIDLLPNKPINVEIIDHLDENYRNFIREYAIDDYPTIVFMKGNTVMSIHSGTMAVPQIIHEIKLWFN